MSKRQDSETFRVGWWNGADFFITPRVIYREWGPYLGTAGLAVYTALASYADSSTGDAYPSLDLIAANTDLTAKTVGECIGDMVELGLIAKTTVKSETGKQERNEYTLLKPGSPTTPIDAAPRFRRAAQRKARQEAKSAASQVMITSQPSNDYSASQVTITAKPSNTPLGGQVIITQELESIRNKNQENKNQGCAPISAPPNKPSSSPSKVKTAPRQRDPKLSPDEQAYYAETVPVMAEACCIDLAVEGAWARCQKQLRALYHATVRPTPDLLRREYIQPGGHWYTHDWRGLKGQAPEPQHIAATWGAATTYRDKSNGHARAAPATGYPPQEDGTAALRAKYGAPAHDDPLPPGVIEGRAKRVNAA